MTDSEKLTIVIAMCQKAASCPEPSRRFFANDVLEAIGELKAAYPLTAQETDEGLRDALADIGKQSLVLRLREKFEKEYGTQIAEQFLNTRAAPSNIFALESAFNTGLAHFVNTTNCPVSLGKIKVELDGLNAAQLVWVDE